MIDYRFQPQGNAHQDLARLERHLRSPLPDDYRRFVTMCAGFYGIVGRSYLVLWSADEIVEEEAYFNRADDLPGFMAIGHDGAEELFGLDTRSVPPAVVKVPRSGWRWDEAIPVSTSFGELFLALLTDADDRTLPPPPVGDRPSILEPASSLVLGVAASPDQLAKVRGLFRGGAPDAYLRFIAMSDGATGQIGAEPLSVWSVEEVVRCHEASEFLQAPHVVVFGDDGRGTFYGFDQMREMIVVAFRADADAAAPAAVAASFGELFLALFARKDSLTLPVA